jgi:hypothetical protein
MPDDPRIRRRGQGLSDIGADGADGDYHPDDVSAGIPIERPIAELPASERVNARLKDEFGASHIRVRGAAKVMAHLMFGVAGLDYRSMAATQSTRLKKIHPGKPSPKTHKGLSPGPG